MNAVYAIRSSQRRTMTRSVKKAKTEPGMATYAISRCELDTRADTICAGINCRPLIYTGQQCEVRGFSEDFEPLHDIPVATVATAWCDGLGGPTYILIIHEALYFGSSMGHSLINPNQIRHHGIQVYNNPYDDDPERAIGIKIYDDVRLPFHTDGSTVYFESKYPTDDELETCPHITLTSDTEWNPSEVVMGLHTDRIVEGVMSDRHHLTYETDCHLFNTSGNTEQLLYERIIDAVHGLQRKY